MKRVVLKARTERTREQCLLASERACEFSIGAGGDWCPLGFSGDELAVVLYDGVDWSIRAVRGSFRVAGNRAQESLVLESPCVISFGSGFLIVDDELEAGTETLRLQSLLAASLLRRAGATRKPQKLAAAEPILRSARSPRPSSTVPAQLEEVHQSAVDESDAPTIAFRLERLTVTDRRGHDALDADGPAPCVVAIEGPTRASARVFSLSEQLDGVWQDELTPVVTTPSVRNTLATQPSDRASMPSEQGVDVTQFVDVARLYEEILLERRLRQTQTSAVLEAKRVAVSGPARRSGPKTSAWRSFWAAAAAALLAASALFALQHFTRNAQARSAEHRPAAALLATVQPAPSIGLKETPAILPQAVAGTASAKLAADALIRGELGQALAAYRALVRAEPGNSAYPLIVEVLTRRIARERKQ
jgi:hypothetical protein